MDIIFLLNYLDTSSEDENAEFYDAQGGEVESSSVSYLEKKSRTVSRHLSNTQVKILFSLVFLILNQSKIIINIDYEKKNYSIKITTRFEEEKLMNE